MPTDIYTLGIEVDSTDVKTADKDLDNLAVAADKAGNEVQDLGVKAKAVAPKVKTMGTKAKAAGTATKGMGRNAGQAGIQIQQMVGQIQGGQSAFVALSQQSADLGIVLGAPLVGVIVSLGAVLVGTLVKALGGVKKESADLIEEIKELSDEFDNLTAAQTRFLRLDIATKQDAINDRINILNASLQDNGEELLRYQQRLTLATDKKHSAGVQIFTERVTNQAKEVDKLRAQLDTEYQALQRLGDQLDIINGKRDETTRKGRTPWWGGDESVEREAAAIRMQIFRDAQAEVDAARQQNVDGYHAILQLQYQSTLVFAELERDAEQSALNDRMRAYQEYSDARIDSDIAVAKERERVEQATQQNVFDINKSFGSLFTTLMNSQSKELFEIGKIGAAGKAANDAYGAINATLAEGGAFAIPAAVAIGAAAFANVTSILSSKFGSPSTSAGTAPTVPDTTPTSTTENTQNVQNTFNITGGNSDSIAGQIQELFDSGELSFKNGSVISA